MLTVSFDEVEAALVAIDASFGAAEAHGALCGSLVTDGGLTAPDWLDELNPRPATAEDALRARNLLATLFDETREALSAADMEFQPLLPIDSAPLEARVAALAAWCEGYLYGFGVGEGSTSESLPEEVNEVLKDFGEISRATTDEGETEESSEASYAELVEYLRAATQLSYEELGGQRERTVHR